MRLCATPCPPYLSTGLALLLLLCCGGARGAGVDE